MKNINCSRKRLQIKKYREEIAMEYKEIYAQWLENSYFDEATKEELK